MACPLEQIRRNAHELRAKIDAAAGGRAVAFLAACKTQPSELLRACAEFDFDLFGENRAQELVRNHTAGAYGAKPVHFIGALQTNKVRDVVGRASLIHSADSERLIAAIDRQAEKRGAVQDILVEINIAAEPGKSGVSPGQADELLARAGEFAHIRVRGLMAIPPKSTENRENTRYFESLYKLFIDIEGKRYDNVIMEILSMGMSGDFETAIKCGSNLVRVGSALFGPRE